MAVRGHVQAGYEAVLARHGLAGLEEVFAWSGGQRLDKSTLERWRQRWRIRLEGVDPAGAPLTLYLKRFDRPPCVRQLQRWAEGHWFRSTALVEWDNARQLAAAGIEAARAVACGEHRLGPWERRSFVLLAEVPGESLERWLPARWSGLPHRVRRRILDQLARFIGRFHAAGFVHRDLYLSHVFLTNAGSFEPQVGAGARIGAESGGGPPGDGLIEPAFALIDLQRVFQPRWRRRRWVVKDLAALHHSTPSTVVGMAERLRFLLRYTREHGRWSARRLARGVAAKAARMAGRSPRNAARTPPTTDA